jgi:hypothetical protein
MQSGTPPAAGSTPLLWDDPNTVLTDFHLEFVDKIFCRSNRHVTLAALQYAVEDGKFRDAAGAMLSDLDKVGMIYAPVP